MPDAVNSLAIRAGMSLAREFAGRGRAKRVARALNCSERMAKYLLAGQDWTLDRLEQVGALLDWGVENWLSQPATSEDHQAGIMRSRILQAQTETLIEECRVVHAESEILRKQARHQTNTLTSTEARNVAGLAGGMVEGLARTIWSVSVALGRAPVEAGDPIGARAAAKIVEPA